MKPAAIHLKRNLLVIHQKGKILLAPSPRVLGFWDLPEPFKGARIGASLGEFRHVLPIAATGLRFTKQWYGQRLRGFTGLGVKILMKFR